MHDQTKLTVGRATRALQERIWPAVHATSVPTQVGANHLPGEPIPPEQGIALQYEPFEVGSDWGPAWATTWFKVTGTVPTQWAGRRVELAMDLGFNSGETGFQCEGLVYRSDLSPVKSLNPRNQWVLVAEKAVGGEQIELYVEAAANPLLLGDMRFRPTMEGDIQTSSRRPLYTLRRVDLAVFEPEVHALALDLEVLLELQEELPQAPRRMQILQAMDDALDVLDLQDIAGTASQARAELAAALAAPAESSAHALSAIGHAHIDSAWLWPIRETIRKVARTCSSMTELIDADDDFIYGMSSAQQFAWLKEHRPEVYARVKDAVAAGRFAPIGGMWVESDTVMPSGESLVRQFLYGQRFFEAEFGVTCHGVWLPDSFGYSPALPQLMRRAGFDWFFTQKISWNQVNTFPHHTFDWEGIDGSRMLSHFAPMDTYTGQLSGAEVAKASRQFQESRRAGGSIAPIGWGDGGGGTTREMTGKAQRLANLEGSPTVRWEHPDAFYARTREQLPNPPVWVGELYLELHRATLTSQHRTKQGNRRTEHLLVEAELLCATAAARVGFAYPHEELDALWQQVLLLQFHDILPGTSIAWVHREAVEQYRSITEAVRQIIDEAIVALVGAGSKPVQVNASGYAQGGVAAGAGVVTGGPDEAAESKAGVELTQDGDAWVMDNGIVRVRIDSAALVTSAIEVATGREAITPGGAGNRLHLHQDFPNKWDAWDVDRFYANRVQETGAASDLRAEVVEGVATITTTRPVSADSTVQQVISLSPGSRTVVFDQVADWHETEKFLKVAFDLDVRAEYTVAETQFGHLSRPTHTNTSWEAAKFETSMHRFVQVAEPGFGVALVNDSSYGYDVSRVRADTGHSVTLRLSLLRAPRFPDPETDQGEQSHRFGLVVGADTEVATREGAVLNTPVRQVLGERGFEPLVELQGEGLALASVKQAADRSGDVVVRVYQATGARSTGQLTVNVPATAARTVTLLEQDADDLAPAELIDGRIQLSLNAFEVRTLRLSL